jgi:hypothetical protein
MPRQYVDSSTIASAGYDRTTLSLELEFKDGSVYRYLNVAFSVVENFMQAGSPGQYLNEHIRDQCRSRKVE